MTGSPDIAGFKEAQVRLVEALGNEVTFYFAPSAQVYPSGTYIDPETNKPLDPTIQPSSQVEFPSVSAIGMVVRSVPSVAQGADAERVGLVPAGQVWLRFQIGSFDPLIVSSKHCEVFGEMFRILRRFYDGMGVDADTLYMQAELATAFDFDDLAPLGGELVTVGTYQQETFVATDGQTVFPTSDAFAVGSTEVYINGVRQALGASYDYIESGQTIVMNGPVEVDSLVVVAYMKT